MMGEGNQVYSKAIRDCEILYLTQTWKSLEARKHPAENSEEYLGDGKKMFPTIIHDRIQQKKKRWTLVVLRRPQKKRILMTYGSDKRIREKQTWRASSAKRQKIRDDFVCQLHSESKYNNGRSYSRGETYRIIIRRIRIERTRIIISMKKQREKTDRKQRKDLKM